MTEILIAIALLAQNAETPAVAPDPAAEKAAEPAPVPMAAPAPAPVAPPPALPAAPGVKPQGPPQAATKPTSKAAFAAGGLTEGLLFMPYWGINSALGADNYSVGQRLGLFVGWNVNGNIACNAELTMDVLDANSFSFTSKPTDKIVAIAASPLVRFHLPHAMWVLGPSVGYFGRDLWMYGGNTVTAHVSSRGWVLGLAVGAFMPVGRVALGGLAGVRIYLPTRTCNDTGDTGWGFDSERCGGGTSYGDTKRVVGLAGAVLF
jgi:hypothetical protein